MNRIKLTLEKGEEIFINMDSVTAIYNRGGFSVLTMPSDESWSVKESVAEVLRLEQEGKDKSSEDKATIRRLYKRINELEHMNFIRNQGIR